jgi:hypothetical protein
MQVKRMNWFVKRPLHEQMDAFRQRGRQATQRFLDRSATATASLATAQNNLSIGMATLAAQASIVRVQNEIQAARSAGLSGLDLSI